jgi:hypothetical protein
LKLLHYDPAITPTSSFEVRDQYTLIITRREAAYYEVRAHETLPGLVLVLVLVLIQYTVHSIQYTVYNP